MSIKIGDNNKITKSDIIDCNDNNIKHEDTQCKSFFNRHTLLTGIIASIIVCILMMFPFWDKVETFIQNLF